MDAPTHIHGWHRNSRRSRDQRRTRRELRVCPAVTPRHLDRFIWLYEDTVWVNEADIEREISADTGSYDISAQVEQPNNPDELWRREWPSTTTQGKAITDALPSTSTSTGADTKTQKDPVVFAQDQRLTAHDEIMAIMMERLNVTANKDNNTNTTPSTTTRTTPSTTTRTTHSTNTDTTPSPSTSVAADTSTQPKPETTGELEQKEYSPQLMSLLDWFLTNKERIGNVDVPGGSGGKVFRHGNVE